MILCLELVVSVWVGVDINLKYNKRLPRTIKIYDSPYTKAKYPCLFSGHWECAFFPQVEMFKVEYDVFVISYQSYCSLNTCAIWFKVCTFFSSFLTYTSTNSRTLSYVWRQANPPTFTTLIYFFDIDFITNTHYPATAAAKNQDGVQQAQMGSLAPKSTDCRQDMAFFKFVKLCAGTWFIV